MKLVLKSNNNNFEKKVCFLFKAKAIMITIKSITYNYIYTFAI